MPDRLQQEIEDILGRFEKFPLREPLWKRIRRNLSRRARSAGQFLASYLPRITVGRVMLVGAALILGAYFFEFGGQSIARTIIIVGLILFAGAFVLSLRRRYPRVERRWRGRPIDLQEPSMSSRFRSWWDRWRSRRGPHG